MKREDFQRRERAWAEFHEWERRQPVDERPLEVTLALIRDALRIAGITAPPIDPPEEKAARIALMRKALATIKPPA